MQTNKKVKSKALTLLMILLFFLSPNIYADAVNDSFSTAINTTLKANVLKNDTGYRKEVTKYLSPSHGTILRSNKNGHFEYMPDKDYTGTDTFSYNMKYKKHKYRRRWYASTAKVTIHINNPNPSGGSVSNADDLCYGDTQTSGFDVGPFSFMTKTTIPIKNLSSDILSNVHVALGTSSLFSAFKDCGVNDTSGNCESASGKSFMMFSAFNHGIDYNLPDYSPNERQTVYNSALFSFLNSDYDWVASYTKNGKTYQGKLKRCGAIDKSTGESTGGRDFQLRHQENIRGNVKSIGNTVLCELDSLGKCEEPTGNNAHIDLQPAPTSSATLTLPKGASVVYARIYWQGRGAATSSKTAWSRTLKNKAETIYLKKDTGAYYKLTADVADFDSTNADNWVNIYSASADASSIVTGAGTYYVDTTRFETNTGETKTSHPYDVLGNYGGWMLVVAYHNPNSKITRNISIFDGYKVVSEDNPSVDVNVSGFLTPKTGDVNSTLDVFAGEGDKDITGDQLKMAGKRYNTELTNISLIPDNAFFSKINVPAPRNPNLTDNSGIDIQQYNVGTTANSKDIITNNETGAKFQFTSTQDTYFPSVIVFSTQIYAPNLCYDYTYGQNGYFITAPSIKPPLLDGTFDKFKPINIKLYFKNLENSDITIKNLTLDVDLNTSIVKYKPETVYVTPPNKKRQPIPDSDLNVSSTGNYVNNIPIGDVGSLDYFYASYSLDANRTKIDNMPINVTLKYNLHVVINGVSTPLDNVTTNIQDMNPCQSGSYYQPVPGRFNVVYKADQNNSLSSKYYYNLPTQIVKRYTDNYLVESMDPNDLNKSKKVAKDQNVTVDMINVAGFHYATASCTDQNATIISTKSVSAVLKKNTYITDLNKIAMQNAGFFNKAVRNAAFRLSYYKDGNTSGAKIKTCSRDNFAIRPAAFYITIKDQNQTSPVSKRLIATNEPPKDILKLAAGYKYDLNVTAVNAQQDNNASPGFYTTLSNISDDNASYRWSPQTSQNVSGCNDITDHDINVSFKNGSADMNTSLSQVGRYILKMVDSTWTNVDHNPAYMAHHTRPYFETNKNGKPMPDCTLNSSVVQPTNSSQLNGCDISSDADNNVLNLKYHDINVAFYPYKFNLATIKPSLGLDHNKTDFGTPNSFVYMSDINNTADENMSFHLNGQIKAEGEDNATLSNFVAQCYAKPIDINISKTNITTTPSFLYIFHDLNASGQIESNTTGTLNSPLDAIQLSDGNFTKNLKGVISQRLNLNFDRNQTSPVNPQRITFKSLAVSCDCSFYADLIDKNTTGVLDLNKTVTFYYGRVHAPDYKYQGSSGSGKIYYEVYDDNASKKSLLPDGNNTQVGVDSVNWYINKHNVASKDGNVTSLQEDMSPPNVTATPPTTASPAYFSLKYNGSQDYPYRTTMKINAPSWLIYNMYNPKAKTDDFNVGFYKARGDWAGVQDTNTSTDSNASAVTIQRVLW